MATGRSTRSLLRCARACRFRGASFGRSGKGGQTASHYFGDPDELTDQAALETSFSFKSAARRRASTALAIEDEARSKLAIVDWIVACTFFLAAVVFFLADHCEPSGFGSIRGSRVVERQNYRTGN